MYNLSLRKLEVLKYLALGLFNKEIAEKMCITRYTVKAYISSILYKLNISSRTEAVYVAVKNKIIEIQCNNNLTKFYKAGKPCIMPHSIA